MSEDEVKSCGVTVTDMVKFGKRFQIRYQEIPMLLGQRLQVCAQDDRRVRIFLGSFSGNSMRAGPVISGSTRPFFLVSSSTTMFQGGITGTYILEQYPWEIECLINDTMFVLEVIFIG